MDNRAGDGKSAEAFEGFVENVAGIEVGGDENVGASGDLRGGEFFGGDYWVDSGVELHFAVDEPIGKFGADSVDSVMDFFEIGIFTARAVGGVGKQSDARSFAGKGGKSSSGVFDNPVKLFFIWQFIHAAVGEGEKLVGFFTDKTTGEKV